MGGIKLKSNKVNGPKLMNLSDEYLVEIGISLHHRNKFKSLRNNLMNSTENESKKAHKNKMNATTPYCSVRGTVNNMDPTSFTESSRSPLMGPSVINVPKISIATNPSDISINMLPLKEG